MANPIEFLEHRIAPATIIAATSNNELLRFDSATPATIDATITITGLLGTMGETLVGIDFRPATGGLYGFTVNDASQGQLYRIDPASGLASAIGSPVTDPGLTLSKTAGYGFDFNPVADRIRVVNSDGENFRVNPNDGTLAGGAVDTDLTGGSVIHGSAYDRSFAGAAQTTLFGIDVNTDQLVLQGSINGTPNLPDTGVITNLGALNVNALSASFDIANGTGVAFAALLVGSTSGLYTINLTTGAATSVGDIGTGTNTIVGMAVATEQIRIVNPKTATFTDVDGDIVIVKITKGELSSDLFELGAGPNGGAYLRLLNLTDESFFGTNLTITAKPGPNGGNKLASVGYINATGNDLGLVTINGDLREIDAGDGEGGNSLKSLSVYSFGAINPTIPTTDLISTLDGSLPKLKVKKDFRGAHLLVLDSADEGVGRLGSVSIGGSLVGGSLQNEGVIQADAIGSVRIARNLEGGSAIDSGLIEGFESIGSITIGGSLIGGATNNTGQISGGGDIGKIVIKGAVNGGAGINSGRIFGDGNLASLTIGALIGGSNASSGVIDFGDGTIKSITVKGSIVGGTSSNSATIEADNITKLTVLKSIIGTGNGTASVTVNTSIGSVKIGRDLSGGEFESAKIVSEGGIGNVFIGGSITGTDENSAAIEGETVGNVFIKGSLIGANDDCARILANSSMGKVFIGGNVLGIGFDSGDIQVDEGSLASILIRGSVQGGEISAAGDIGAIVISGDASGSSGDVIQADGTIKSITINGSLHSGYGTGDISADSLGSIKIGGNVTDSFINANEGGIGPVRIKGSVAETTIDSGGNIGVVNVGGNVSDSSNEGTALSAVGKIDAVTIKGSILAVDDGAAITAGVLGPVIVGGDITGTDLNRIVITAVGTQATQGTADVAIASVTVKGHVQNANILAGYFGATPINADAQIGKVIVGGDWVKSNLVAGVVSEDAVFGNSDDAIISEISQVPGIVASIASITIKGSVLGTFGGTDLFAFTAEEIKAVSIGGVKVILDAGAGNDDLFAPSQTQDLRIREVSLI
jgi:hypothetical protein